MTIVAAALLLGASAVHAAGAFSSGRPVIGGAALAIAAWSVASLLWDRRGQTLSLIVLAHTILAATAVGTGAAPAPTVAGLTAALYGWDTALTARVLASLPRRDRRVLALVYLRRSGVLAILGVAAALAAPALRIPLGFRSGLATALAAFAAAALLVRLALPPARRGPGAKGEPGGGTRRPAR